MQWDDARIFLAFAREGSFGKAAKRLGVQYSTVSRRIHALEEKLGTSLIERSATGFVLTEAGQELERSAALIERELLSFEAATAGQNHEVAGDLHVTAIANMASTVLMPVFARFMAAHPQINLRLEVTNSSVQLAAREADVALRQTNAPQETLIGTRLTTIASAVYGSGAYCAALDAGEAAERWVGVDCCDYHRTWTKEACPEDRHAFCVDDTSLTVAALKEGLGVGYLPCFLGDTDPALTRYRPPDARHDLGLWLLYHRDLRATRRVTLFREHMQREIRDLVPLFEGAAPAQRR